MSTLPSDLIDVAKVIKDARIRRAGWVDGALDEAWNRAQKILRDQQTIAKLQSYAGNPVGFIKNALGEILTPAQINVCNSVCNNRVTIAKSGNAVGKAQPIHTPIPTPDGWKRMDELKIGDRVFTQNGQTTTVTGIYPQGLQPVFRVIFNDDTSILASADHLWVARASNQQYRQRPYKVYTTEQLARTTHRHMHIPMCAPVEYPHRDLPIDPYILGVLLGDGCLTVAASFSSDDQEIVEKIASKLPDDQRVSHNGRLSYRIVTRALGGKPNTTLDAIRQMGLIGAKSADKFIPTAYLLSSPQQRLQLLYGLMDTDGTIGVNHSITFTSISPKLAGDVRELVESLGGTAKIRTKRTFYTHNGVKLEGQLAYNVYIKAPFCPFSLPRKVERYTPEDQMQKQAQRVIQNVQYVGMQECLCIRVSDPSRLYLSDHYVVTHNSFVAARLAVWFFLVYPDSKIFLVAAPPLDNLRRILWGEIMNIVRIHPELFSPYKMRTLSMSRYSQKNVDDPSFIAGLTIPTSGSAAERQSKFSGKHAPHLMFIVDEGDAVPDEIYKGMESCMSGGHDRMLVMFNPKHQSGQMYHMERRGLANIVPLSAFEHPNVTSGETIIPGAVDRQKVIVRINEWTRPLALDEKVNPNCYQVPDFLVGQTTTAPNGAEYEPLADGWREVKEPEFWYMVLGDYPAQGELQLISREWINNARARWDLYVSEHGEVPPAGVQPIMGLDVSEFGSDANIACFRYGGFVARMQPWVGVDPMITADKAVQLYLEKNADIVMVDGTGVGSGVAPAMARKGWDMKPERDVRAVSVKVSERPSHLIKSEKGEFKILRDQLWWATREWLRTDNTAMLPPDEQLIDELICPTYQIPYGKIMIMRKEEMRDMLKRSPNRADALCLTHAPFARPTVMRLVGE